MRSTELEDLHIAVVGPGALGCLLAASFSLAGLSVSLFDHRPERVNLLRRQGITLIRPDTEERVMVPVSCPPDAPWQPDLLFLCVKSSAVAAAVNRLRPLLNANNLLIALQNGIGHFEALERFVTPHGPWAAGVTALGAHLRAAGEVILAGSGLSRFGFTGPASDLAHQLLQRAVAAFSESGFQAEVAASIEQRIWEKLMINVGINALTAIHNLANGELLADPAIMDTMKAVIAEAEKVARASGIVLTGDALENTVAVCKTTAANISSMLQDVRLRKPTEIDAINGAIVRLARGLRIEVPVNRTLTEQVRNLEKSYR